jgi:predicted cupin superfamily sugar epimerase
MTTRPTAGFWIAHLGLLAHPEGGYYRETYRSTLQLSGDGLPPAYAGPRAASTAIYFLVTAGHPSCFHRLQTDEIWHFYAGDTLEICCLSADGVLEVKRLGMDVASGDCLQQAIPAGTWFGARVAGEYALCGCTMAPGFDFQDFELGTRAAMVAQFPAHGALIQQLTTA